MLNLGIMLVVANLGTCCLLGEPAKRRNNIVCLPRQKLIIIAKEDTVHYVPYDAGTQKYSLIRAINDQHLEPGDQLVNQLPDLLAMEAYVNVTPRPAASHWLKPTFLKPSNCTFFLVNNSSQAVHIRKFDHIADIRDIIVADIPIKPIAGIATHDDKFQFMDFSSSRNIKEDCADSTRPRWSINCRRKRCF